ncbi:MAG: hypothetical protein AAFY15_04630, partial [Cyanobacteria bacterium J06648_11]
MAAGAGKQIVTALQTHSESHVVAMRGCLAISDLARASKSARASLMAEGAGVQVLAALSKHAEHAEAAAMSCRALWHLALDSAGAEALVP